MSSALPFVLVIRFVAWEYQACHFVHQAMVSVDVGGRFLLPPALARGTAGGTDPTCPTLSKSYRLLYIPSSTDFGRNWCPWFGAKIYAKMRKTLIRSLINFLTRYRYWHSPVI